MVDYTLYDLSEDDPYLIPGSTCLINNLGITNTQKLNEAEKKLTAISYSKILLNPPPLTFDASHLKQIHLALFSRVYPFAGEFRTTEIAKGGELFLPHKLVEQEVQACTDSLRTEGLLLGLEPSEFGDRAGHYLAWINNIHPFREGNGRTQRLFISHLAKHNGLRISWDAVSGSAMVEASRAARGPEGETRMMRRLISINTYIDPEHGRSPLMDNGAPEIVGAVASNPFSEKRSPSPGAGFEAPDPDTQNTHDPSL